MQGRPVCARRRRLAWSSMRGALRRKLAIARQHGPEQDIHYIEREDEDIYL